MKLKASTSTGPFTYLSLLLSEEHGMYPLHFTQRQVQPDPPLYGCYHGDTSRAKTKAKHKLSSVRQEALAQRLQPNLAWLIPFLSLSLSRLVSYWRSSFPSKYWLRETNESTWLIEMKGRENSLASKECGSCEGVFPSLWWKLSFEIAGARSSRATEREKKRPVVDLYFAFWEPQGEISYQRTCWELQNWNAITCKAD